MGNQLNQESKGSAGKTAIISSLTQMKSQVFDQFLDNDEVKAFAEKHGIELQDDKDAME